MNHDGDHDELGGLVRDLRTLSRRGMLELVAKGAAGLTLLGACGDDGAAVPFDGDPGACSRIPGETAGPFPGDGTNGANILTIAGVERSDIRASIGTATGIAPGVELALTLTLVSAATCAPLAGHAIYIWQCDRAGAYSMYAGTAMTENYLRGVQVTDANGQVTFTTVFPACYPGRWPHVHFEVFASLAAATNGSASKAVSQLAFPKATCDLVYATTGYEPSVASFANVSLSSDSVFRDGSSLQMATIAGTTGSGLTAGLTVAIA